MKDKTDVCASLLRHLGENSEARACLVEDLRCAATLLDGTYADDDVVIKERVSQKTARRLREVAASLCDHARTHGAHCRYCEAVLPDARYDQNQLVRSIR